MAPEMAMHSLTTKNVGSTDIGIFSEASVDGNREGHLETKKEKSRKKDEGDAEQPN